MIPPVYETCEASSAVKGLFGTEPRVYEFGSAPENTTPPYVVWQTISGAPENNVSSSPDHDYYRVQIDCYSASKASVITASRAVRDAVEAVTNIISWNGEGQDPITKEYTYSFDAEFFVPRE